MNEAQQIVKNINNRMFDECTTNEVDSTYFSYLEYIETPIGDYVKWMGQCLWDSENETREWINDEQEDLELFLVREMIKVEGSILAQLEVVSLKHKALASIYKNRPSREEIRQRILDSCKPEEYFK